MKENYSVSGVDINVRYMTLPIRKGLSSSAAVSVLTVKAFNILYKLNLTSEEIMEIAYKTERYALSKCGRLDQVCAKGLGVSHLVFYENSVTVHPVNIGKKMYYVVADLNGKKDTKKILSAMHQSFPFPENDIQENINKLLCSNNKRLINMALASLEKGNLENFGQIMYESQEELSIYGGMVCEDLKAPKLHMLINDDNIRKLSYGARGTGSIKLIQKHL